MRKLVILVALVGLAAAAGCGVTRSSTEIRNVVKQNLDMDMRQLVDDWNMLWLADRQSRRTRWHTR